MIKRLIDLKQISEEELLKTRISDFPLKINGTWVESCVRQLYQELESQGIVFKPQCYLADEWLTPEGETCIGIPFYLAHPTLIHFERKYMFEAEGEGESWCMRLLRHETGHALCYAYRLNQRKQWQKLFGSSAQEYGDSYKYRPYSKNYVRHLEGYYAQYHPDEDFVETFAVWLTPGLDWRRQYQGWKALEKLEYVDRLMKEIRGKKAPVKNNQKFWRLSTLRYTLEQYYKKKRSSWEEDFPEFHDDYLKKIFFVPGDWVIPVYPANDLISKYRQEILDSVARSTGVRKYIVSEILKSVLNRCRDLKLRCHHEQSALIQLTSYVASLMMNYQYTGHLRGKKKKGTK
jgi:hypothetical protein